MKNYKIDLQKAVSEKVSLHQVSMKVQKHAIRLGCQWANDHPEEPRHMPSKYLFITGTWLAHGLSMSDAEFQEHPNELISVKDFLALATGNKEKIMDKKEAQKRLAGGECPTLEAFIFYFDEQSNRFMYHTAERTIQGEIQGFWSELDKWYWPETFEQSGKYEICWVSDNNPKERVKISVVRYDCETGVYRNKDNIPWEYATPVKPEECWGYKDE